MPCPRSQVTSCVLDYYLLDAMLLNFVSYMEGWVCNTVHCSRKSHATERERNRAQQSRQSQSVKAGQASGMLVRDVNLRKRAPRPPGLHTGLWRHTGRGQPWQASLHSVHACGQAAHHFVQATFL
eukprot:363444-Chlamydomonas_euryale.AAC.3